MIVSEIIQLIENNHHLTAIKPRNNFVFPKPRVNPFLIITDKYQKENLHTEIIKYFLDPTEDHCCDIRFLKMFIEYIGLSFDDFDNPITAIEEGIDGGRMDITIKGSGVDQKENVILIENKINDAGDTYRQIPTYYNGLTNQGYKVRKIVYLSLEGYKSPSTIGWKQHEIDSIVPLVCRIGAFTNEPTDLVNGWLEKCIDPLSKDDVNLFIRHYIELLKFRRGTIMNEKDLNELFEFIIQDDNESKIEYLAILYNSIGRIMAKHLNERWEEYKVTNHPVFKTYGIYKDIIGVFSSFNFNDHPIKFTVDFARSYENTQIRLRLFVEDFRLLPNEISEVLELHKFEKLVPETYGMQLLLSKEESKPSKENEVFGKIFKILEDISNVTSKTLG